MPRTGYVITYARFPVLWCSRLQAEVVLSATEVEYITLIQAIRKVIPVMALIKELSFIFYIHIPRPELFSKVFEYNKICIDVAESNKFSPITKHIATNYHHFQNLHTKEDYPDMLY